MSHTSVYRVFIWEDENLATSDVPKILLTYLYCLSPSHFFTCPPVLLDSYSSTTASKTGFGFGIHQIETETNLEKRFFLWLVYTKTLLWVGAEQKKGWDYFFIDLDFENWQKLILLSGLHRATQSNMKEEVNMLWCKKLFQIVKHML